MDWRSDTVNVNNLDSIPLQNTTTRVRPDVGYSNRSSEAADSSPQPQATSLVRPLLAHGSPENSEPLNSIIAPLNHIQRPSGFVMSTKSLLSGSSSTVGNDGYDAVPCTDSRPVRNSSRNLDDEVDGSDTTKSQGITGAGKPRQYTFSSNVSSRSRLQSDAPSIETEDTVLSQRLLDGLRSSNTGNSAINRTERPPNCTRTQSDSSENPTDNSPYPEVRASVSATDNSTVSINTPRMWILSLLFAFCGSATNLFFSLRYPSVAITPVIALVLVHPMGKLWDISLKRHDDPDESFVDGVRQQNLLELRSFKRKVRLWLSQGRWNEKEHACVYISSNVSFGFAFATDVIVEQHKFYKQDVPILYQILLTLSTQILGYAFAGLTRRFLVRPAAMIWPGTLMSTAMFGTMHKQENAPANGWKISRYRFFLYVWGGAFAWYFLPGLLFPALSYFSVITWFAPKNVVIANLVRQPLVHPISLSRAEKS
jgi:hypothetical protein